MYRGVVKGTMRAMPLVPPEDGSLWHDSRRTARAIGKKARKRLPRTHLGRYESVDGDPVALLDEQNRDRVPELVPLRMQRMVADPFSFYRGTAAIMAADLAGHAHSGILVAACGDAHISNFGFYASPERRIVFDLNDFDEAAVAPWEWDVKRLITSVLIAGHSAQYAEQDVLRMAQASFTAYASTLARAVKSSPVDRYFMHMSLDLARASLSDESRQILERSIAAAERRTPARTIRRMTERVGGRLRFVQSPPTMTRVDLENEPNPAGGDTEGIAALYGRYRDSVDLDIDTVLSQYLPTDLARRVVGVGSVGTQCFLQLLEGADDDTLLLQIKEASASVLARYGGIQQPSRLTAGIDRYGEGDRVTGMQRLMQAVSDPFLGRFRSHGRDFYVRQFRDGKGSVELSGLPVHAFEDYVEACAIVLARSHAQSPTSAEVVGYIGRSDTVSRGIVAWCTQYEQRSRSDFERVAASVGSREFVKLEPS